MEFPVVLIYISVVMVSSTFNKWKSTNWSISKKDIINHLIFNEFYTVLRHFWPGYHPYSLYNSKVQLIVLDNYDTNIHRYLKFYF